jgi:hypothetical protein
MVFVRQNGRTTELSNHRTPDPSLSVGELRLHAMWDDASLVPQGEESSHGFPAPVSVVQRRLVDVHPDKRWKRGSSSPEDSDNIRGRDGSVKDDSHGFLRREAVGVSPWNGKPNKGSRKLAVRAES